MQMLAPPLSLPPSLSPSQTRHRMQRLQKYMCFTVMLSTRNHIRVRSIKSQNSKKNTQLLAVHVHKLAPRQSQFGEAIPGISLEGGDPCVGRSTTYPCSPDSSSEPQPKPSLNLKPSTLNHMGLGVQIQVRQELLYTKAAA